MTQPDLQAMALAKVDERIAELSRWNIDNGFEDTPDPCLRALRKAIERHTPEPYGANCPYVCSQCVGHHGLAAVPFPCPELTEIAKEMGI